MELTMELKENSMVGVGATIPIKSIKACVVYDLANGQIHHEHRVVTLDGGCEPTESEMAADALRFISDRHQPQKGNLDVLHVHYGSMEQGKRYRVDIQKKALIVE
jgi:hypothetical protein